MSKWTGCIQSAWVNSSSRHADNENDWAMKRKWKRNGWEINGVPPIMDAVAVSEPGTTLWGTPSVKASLWFSSESSFLQILNSPTEPQPVEKPMWRTWPGRGPDHCRITDSLDGCKPCPTYQRSIWEIWGFWLEWKSEVVPNHWCRVRCLPLT